MNLVIVKKKIKNSYIRILPTLEVRVSVPKNATDYYINNLINSKQDWILQKLDFVSKQQHNKISQLNTDDKIYYLGLEYVIKVIQSNKNNVTFEGNTLLLYTKNNEFEYKQKLLDKFYLLNAKNILTEIVENYTFLVKKNVNCVKIRKMSSRWGSCNYIKCTINLNSELMKKPLKFIEYVVLHELAHLTHPNHSKDFYTYIERFMPDWKQRCKL
ncbi:MAG: SprT family zinc-dependent metalloprotease [Arcobacteraceae bacterium]|nr:SprT family zinc-dependent metalloprotease [Arcobacteraceae bacterium]